MKLMQIWQCTKYFYISKYFQSKSQWEKSKRSTLLPCDKSYKAFPSFHQTTVKKLHSKTVVLAVVSPINQSTAKTTEMLYKFSSQTTALNYRLISNVCNQEFLMQIGIGVDNIHCCTAVSAVQRLTSRPQCLLLQHRDHIVSECDNQIYVGGIVWCARRSEETIHYTLHISQLVYVTIIVNTSEILKLKLLKMKMTQTRFDRS